VSITFKCNLCGKGYRVKDELAGKKAKCSCGTSIAIPKPQPAASAAQSSVPVAKPVAPVAHPVKAVSKPTAIDEDLFDAEMADATKICPSCKAKVKHDVVLCIQCGYNFRERKKIEAAVTAAAAPAAPAKGMRCSQCGSRDARRVNDSELEAYRERKETAVTVGRPLICNECGHMWEGAASFGNYIASYLKSVVLFIVGVAIVGVTCAVAYALFADRFTGDDASLRGMRGAIRANYVTIAIVIFGLSVAGAGLWGILRTLIVQMGWKGILYDPDEQKW
jgi:hypothetical protein